MYERLARSGLLVEGLKAKKVVRLLAGMKRRAEVQARPHGWKHPLEHADDVSTALHDAGWLNEQGEELIPAFVKSHRWRSWWRRLAGQG